MIRVRERLYHTMICNRNCLMPPVMCSLYKIFDLGNSVHVTHFRMTVELHSLFYRIVFSGFCKIRNFLNSKHRRNDKFAVKFINIGHAFNFQECTHFNFSQNICKLIITHEHLDHDRISKVCHCIHDNGLFIADFSCVKANDFSSKCNFSHLTNHG